MPPESPARPSPLLGAAASAPLVVLLTYLALWQLGAPLPKPDAGATLLAVASTVLAAGLAWFGLRASLARIEGNDPAVAAALDAVLEAQRHLAEASPAQASPGSRKGGPGGVRAFLLGFAAAAVVLGGSWALAAAPGDEPPVHVHAAWALFIDGERVNFTAQSYDLSSTGFLRGHLHAPDHDILHVEGTPGLTMADFFRGGLGAGLWDGGLRLDEAHGGGEYRSQGNRSLHLFVLHEHAVSWVEQPSVSSYRPRDHDRILLTYGDLDEATLRSQTAAVASRFPDL